MKKTGGKTSFSRGRIEIIDLLRGFAVFIMIIFHFSFDLNLLNFASIDFKYNTFWYLFPRVIVFLFFFCVGASLVLAYSSKINWRKFLIRFLKLALGALLVTAATYFLFPERWVYFGTLHSIAFLSLFGLIFINHPITSLILGISLFTFELLGLEGAWFHLGHLSMDYISPFPWFGALLFGIFSIHFGITRVDTDKFLPKKAKGLLKFLGKHSLIIYLIHQPVLFGTLYGVKLIIGRFF